MLGLAAPADSGDEIPISAIETAHRRGSLSTLTSLSERATALLAASTSSRELRLRYALALMAWRSDELRKALPGNEGSIEMLEVARGHLEWILEREPAEAEALVLHAAVLGKLAEKSLLSRITLGAAALRSLERAEKVAPENPRVALQRGIFTLHTPGFAGGGPAAALGPLRRAHALFAAQPRPVPWPDWGQVDSAAWLGQALARLGRIEEARRRYAEGLAIPPPSPWIRDRLLPELP